jgi:DNA-binding transcriptional ArsR family regulator
VLLDDIQSNNPIFGRINNPVSEIAAQFKISRPAISHHLA